MTLEQVKDACAQCATRLPAPVRHDLNEHMDRIQTQEHCAWMCHEIIAGNHDDNIEKVMRWLGFIQGCVATLNIFTIEELKAQNR